MTDQRVSVGDIEFGNDKPFVLVGGYQMRRVERVANQKPLGISHFLLKSAGQQRGC